MCVCVCHWARADATQASQLGALDRETNTALAAVHFLTHTQALAVRDPAHVLPQEQWQGTVLGGTHTCQKRHPLHGQLEAPTALQVTVKKPTSQEDAPPQPSFCKETPFDFLN